MSFLPVSNSLSETLKNLAIADFFASLTKKGKKKEINLSLT